MMLLAGAAVSPASIVCAQTHPAPPPSTTAPTPVPAPAPAPAPSAGSSSQAQPQAAEEPEIVVRAQADQRTSIDRDTYIVRDTAEARSSNALDLLARTPGVTVTPENQVRVLGSGVGVLIDGRPSPNPNILRDLQGSEIARIEVVTNPSAQFSASGAGGIINIVTRNRALDGLRGSVTASTSRYGGREFRASPSWTSGDWTLSGSFGLGRDVRNSESTRERVSLDPLSAAPDTIERVESRNRLNSFNGNGQISYRLNAKRTITLQGGLWNGDLRSSANSEIVTDANPLSTIVQSTLTDSGNSGHYLSLDYREEGSRQGELLTTSVQQYSYEADSNATTDFGTGSFRFLSDSSGSGRNFKIDYIRPLRGTQRLSVGGSLGDTDESSASVQSGDLPLGGNSFPPAFQFTSSTREVTSYVTFQFPLLGATVLSGLRIESRNYDFGDPSLGDGPTDAHLFPSLHIERRMARWLTAYLSYSRRISWPFPQQLSPVLRFIDATTAFAGNPDLRPELTDSIEAKLRAEFARQTVTLTLFDRQTDNLNSTLNTLTDDGVLISQPVNVGRRRDLGAAIAAQGTIARGLTYSLNANLIDRRIERDFGLLLRQHSTTYSATAQLDYRDGPDGRRGTDRLSFSGSYQGPYDDGLISRSSVFRGSASWSHAITDRLSSVLSIDDLFGPTESRSSSISGTALTRTTNFTDGPRYKLALTYSLGRPGQPQPPGATGPSGPSVPVPTGQ